MLDHIIVDRSRIKFQSSRIDKTKSYIFVTIMNANHSYDKEDIFKGYKLELNILPFFKR